MTVKERKTSVAPGKIPASILAQQKLLELFREGTFKSGETLKESVLAGQLGVTRPAMREALTQAVGWGIVEYIPYCGYKIRDFTIYDLLECYELREALEPIAAWRIAQTRPQKVISQLESYIENFEQAEKEGDRNKVNRYDYQFHLAVIENCGNRCFARMQSMANFATAFFFSSNVGEYRFTVKNHTSQMLGDNYTEIEYNELNSKLTIEMHRRMLNSLKEGHADEAEKLFREHAHIQVENLRNIIVYQGQS
jgi:DNA-binding GntR family transcriptional regulator